MFIETEYLRVMLLPELGGRVHRIVDKTRDHDLIYYQPTIKPALVGLAGPWVSGGIEFNWPQHHRPSTAMPFPANLGEARHLLVNPGESQWWLGEACAAMGDHDAAQSHWQAAADFKGDFQGMRVRHFSETTFFIARAMERLGRSSEARAVFEALLKHAGELAVTPAEIDYFATSLPTMLLFEDDLDRRQAFTARLLEAQARFGLGEEEKAAALLDALLDEDPGSAAAPDLRSAIDTAGAGCTGDRRLAPETSPAP